MGDYKRKIDEKFWENYQLPRKVAWAIEFVSAQILHFVPAAEEHAHCMINLMTTNCSSLNRAINEWINEWINGYLQRIKI